MVKLSNLPGLGVYRIQARATDRAGNEGSTIWTFQVVASTPWVPNVRVLSVDPATATNTEGT